VRSALEAERIVLLAEAVPSSIGAPDGRKLPTLGAIGVSQQRLVVYAGGESLIDVTWDDGAARELELGAPDDGLRIVWDGERFGAAKPGRVELLLKVGAQATPIMAAIEQRRRELPPRRRLADLDDE
jgi:hypothetical protein